MSGFVLSTVLIALLLMEWRRRQRTTAALSQSDSRLGLALHASSMGAWDWDRKTNALKWSKQNYVIMGFPPVEIALNYHDWADCVHPEDLGKVIAESNKAIAGDSTYRAEYRVIRPDGAVRWIEEHGEPVYDKHGQCVKVIGLTIDITERKRSELRSQAQSTICRMLSEATSMAEVTTPILRQVCEGLDWDVGEVWEIDHAPDLMTQVESWNKPSSALSEFNDISRQLRFSMGVGLPGCAWQTQEPIWASDLVSDFNDQRTWLAIHVGLRSAFAFPIRVAHRPFSVMAFYSRETRDLDKDLLQMMADVGGQIGQFIERKQAADALHETEQQNRAILRAIPDFMFLLNKDGVYLDYHARNTEDLAVSPDQFLGKHIREVLPKALVTTFESCFERAFASGEPQTCQYELELKGTHRWYEARIAPCAGSKLLSVVRDITERKRGEDRLRESEKRFAIAFNANPQPMWLTTVEDGRFVLVNESFVTMSGYAPTELIGRTSIALRIYERSVRDKFVGALRQEGKLRRVETEFRTKRGEVRLLLVSAELIQLGGQQYILKASSDITERKQLEEELQRSHREFATFADNSPDVVSRLDRNIRFTYVSSSVERIGGIPPQHMIGRTPSELALPDHDASGFEESCREAFSRKQTVVRETLHNGRSYRTRIIPEFSPDGAIEALLSISEDVTEKVRADQELRRLTARLFDVQDDERRRIARELHDGAAQNVFALSINLENLQRQMAGRIVGTEEVIEECQSLAKQSLQELRTLSYLLHPPILDRAGLSLALRWFVDGFTRRSGIHIEANALEDIGRLPPEIETALFRIAQESLTNVHRHSGSETADIRLAKKGGEVRLEISDRGHGIPENRDRLSPENTSSGVGIAGMRQRLIHLGGRLEIQSGESGTKIVAVVPAPEIIQLAQDHTD
jgi:PAS domain S-box-containing protein